MKRHLLQGAEHEAGPGALGIWSYTAGRVGEGGSLLYLGVIDQDNMKLIALCHTDLSVNNECEARSVVNIPTESADVWFQVPSSYRWKLRDVTGLSPGEG